jgi:ligand-binding sensor domain-containing protein/signal transduction histidine kinase
VDLAAYSDVQMTDSLFRYRLLRTLKCVFFISLLFPALLNAQKFHFQNYNVQQGLIQSQVIAITQDHYDNLWFCTLGGVSRFDGKVFTNYSETDGLISNYANSIIADHDSNMWIGTEYGVSKFNGKTFKNIQFSDSMGGNMVRSILEDARQRIWVMAGGKLYQVDRDEKTTRYPVTGLNEKLTAIQLDKQGILWAVVLNKGIFRLESEGWKKIVPLTEFDDNGVFQKIVFDASDSNRMFLLSYNEIFTVNQGVISSLIRAEKPEKFTNIFQDKSNKLWLTSTKGLFQYADSGLIAFNAANGYAGSRTSVIFQDREDNIWFGTNGTGAYRYSTQQFLIFDQFTAERNLNIMPMLENNNLIYIGTGDGLFMYDGVNMSRVKGLSDNPADQNIVGLFNAEKNGIYVLTSSGQFVNYNNGKITKLSLGALKGCVYSAVPDGRGGFWVNSCWGFFNVSSIGVTTEVLDSYSPKSLQVSKDTILVSTDKGLCLVAYDFKYRKINDPLLNKANYMDIATLGKFYLFATSNKGFILYNSITGRYRQFTTKDGLNADFIYSVVTDKRNQIWLGTGRGVNKIVFDTTTESLQISSISIPGDISSSECNQSAGLYDSKNNLWFGTVSGLFKFIPDSDSRQTYLPPVLLQEVEVFSKSISPDRYDGLLNSWYDIPKNLTLHHDENHLTFSFRSPSYMHSDAIQYQYQLEGMEKTYSALSSNHFVVYPALPPGHYTFKARAYLEGVGFSKENVEFPFDIKAAFYQTIYFKFLLVGFVVGMILWIQWIRMRIRVRQMNQIEEVKREENIKVRQTASEDFHDEVGNSLTRIQILTDVLQTKLGTGHDEEKRIIGQIKENVSGLYQGTRDILWALNPESDIIKEIGQRLESLGIDLFQDTGICFSYENLLGASEDVKLPGNYNRNIMMIFKEAMSNSLKHAQARHVKLIIQKSELKEIQIELKDDGMGFNLLYIKKGHGFQNMLKRANRIKAIFAINSKPGEGARYDLRIPLSPV